MVTMKKFISIILTFSMIMIISIFPAHADQEKSSPEDILKIQTELELASYYRNMQWMSESELQKAISYVDQPQIQKHKLKSTLINKLPLQAAWLAAAQIARMRGYKLSAKLVECSIFNKNYSETNGMFAKAIKKTSEWKKMKKKKKGSSEFKKSMNSDLYYSLHKYKYITKSKQVIVTDTFDFKLNTNYKSLFSTMINNWGYLNQNMSILNVIKVRIAINK